MQLGPQLDELIRGTGLCDEVNVTAIPVPLSPLARERSNPNTGLRVMGDAVGRSMILAYTAMKQKVPLITDEVLYEYKEELDHPGRAYYFPIYAAAAQRR